MIPKPVEQNSYTLYVGDLEKSIQDQQLYNVFVQFGPLYSVRILKSSETKQSRGFGFVSFYNQNDAQRAKDSLNHFKILTQPIRVTWKRNPQELSSENNIFVKNIPTNVLQQEFENYFCRFGSIFSAKISHDQDGRSRAYGYVQFDTKESAQKCLSETELFIQNQKLEIYPFNQRSQRGEHLENNLYMKNFPFMAIQELEKKLEALCSKYGEVTSIVAKKDAQNRLFAFVCFKEKQDAKKAMDSLVNLDPFESGTFLYVNWAMKKKDRQDFLQKQFRNHVNETNIFTKNLKDGITVADLKEIFKQFGEIKSGVIKTPSNPAIRTKYGFMDFSNKLEAQKVLIGAPANPLVKSLYEDEKVYLNMFMPRHVYDTYMRNRNHQINNYHVSRNMPSQETSQLHMFQQLLQIMQAGQAPRRSQQVYPPPQNMMPPMNNMNMMPGMIPSMPMGRPQYMQQPGMTYQKTPYKQRYQKFGQTQRPKEQDPKKMFHNLEYLNKNVQEFKQLDQESKRSIFGELLYPQIKSLTKDSERTARITGTFLTQGMLIDFEVFEVEDILELVNNPSQLEERIQEANQLIDQENQ